MRGWVLVLLCERVGVVRGCVVRGYCERMCVGIERVCVGIVRGCVVRGCVKYYF